MQNQFAPETNSIEDAIRRAQGTGELYLGLRKDDESNQFTELPMMIRDLTDLRILALTGTQLTSLPDWLVSLTCLEELHIHGSRFTNFPSVVTGLTRLRYLGLTSCSLTSIPKEIDALRNLTVLELSGNYMSQLPSSVWNLSKLQVLDLGMNPLTSLPEASTNLQYLTHLYMWGHHFGSVPSALRAFNNLEVLDLSTGGKTNLRNISRPVRVEPSRPPRLIYDRTVGGPSNDNSPRLESLPSWLPEALPDLKELYLGGHRLRRLPSTLSAMRNLQNLFLSSNRLDSIPKVVLALPELRRLDLRGNGINELPIGLQRLQKLNYLDLADNPLPIPPEVLDRPYDPEAILDYVSRVQDTAEPLNEAKLLIVGEGSVGKTSLVNRLVHNTYVGNESKTEGIDVTRWIVSPNGDEITVNAWDFGGQEIMHATHQFFLTKRSVYVLVIDSRQGEEQNRIEYWLKLIQGFSDNSPVIIIGNKSDQSVLDIDRRGLKQKYSNIVDIVSVSCLTGKGVTETKEILARTISQLPHVEDLLPVAFFEIKRYLENLQVNYLSFDEYERLCVSSGVISASAQELLIDFLHDLGTVLCFRDDPRLADTNILNPSWVTGGVYRLLNSNLAAQRKGLLTWEDIDKILDCEDYPSSRRFFIIDVMKKFELCYEADRIFLIPDLLTKEEPDTGVWDGALHFEIKYDVLPPSIISRLIVRMSASISKGTVWRTGMVLALDGNRALVKGDREDAAVTVEVSGPKNGRRGLLAAVRTELRGIERTIPGLNSEERVSVPNHHGIWVPYSHLLDLEAAGRQTVVPQGLIQDFSIRDLLAGIEIPTGRTNDRQVISKENAELNPVTRNEDSNAEPWTVRQSMVFGWFLIIATVVVLAGCLIAYKVLGVSAAAAIGVALVIVVVIGLFILRSSGRISEAGLLDTVKEILADSKNDRDG